MKAKTLTALAGLSGAMILSAESNAAYLGLGDHLGPTGAPVDGSLAIITPEVVGYVPGNTTWGSGPYDVFRIYAWFNDPLDYMTFLRGNSTNPATINNTNAAGTELGSGFYNPVPAASDKTPGPYTPPEGGFGTNVAVGAWNNTQFQGTGDPTVLSPGFTAFINGNQWTTNNGSWGVTGDQAQNGADWNQNGQGDGSLRIPIMSLAVASGENVEGTIGRIDYFVFSGLAGGAAEFVLDQAFNSIPAPGALALLGLAGLVGTRRRR